eukprot:COSAG01_NODE_24714_length_769_cov_1.659701_3_plen_69_part_01
MLESLILGAWSAQGEDPLLYVNNPNQMHPFYPALLMLLPLALSAPDKPRRSAEERLDAVESLARHALAR